MASVRGIHILAKGSQEQARRIAPDIQRYNQLLIGTSTMHGAGVYAYYEKCLPCNLKDWPQVLFEVDSEAIVDVRRMDGESRGFFRIPGAIGSCVNVVIIEFANV